MDKKEIYEHLAKIYLDASSKKKKRTKTHLKLYNNLFVIGLVLLVSTGSAFIYFSPKAKGLPSETALFILYDPAKINFNFNPVKKESFTINLNRLNLNRFKALAFSLKNTDKKDRVSLRIEFTNSFKERSEIYVKNIPEKWQDFKISLLDFKNIADWSEMKSVSFSVEEWNACKERGILYIDNVRFLK
jgi:hypothetical protein